MEKTHSGRIKKKELIAEIMKFFQEDTTRAFNYQQVSNALGLTKQALKTMVAECLAELCLQNYLIEISTGKYKFNERGLYVEGLIKRSHNGKNYLLPDDGGDPIFIAERNSAHAMDGDRVRVMHSAKKAFSEPEGEVIAVLEHAENTFVGVLDVEKSYAFLITDSKKLANDIFIPKDKIKGGKSGQKVVVRIIEWPDRAKNPIGEVIDVLGDVGDNNTEMNAIMAEYGLPYTYPEEMEKAAEQIPDVISSEDMENREDFRKVTTFTVDPYDAKDFDDALSVQKLPNGNWEVGVHIADVTHYVKPGTLIDREAENRATSVYLVDRTVPMLPERLCNQICSLRPDEEKLCFSCVFEMDDHAVVKNHRIGRTMIKSNRRFTYEEAQAVIEGNSGDCEEEIRTLDRLAKILRGKRFAAGAINFDRWEVKFNIDEKGKPLSVYFKEAKDSNKMIEEFMLLANRTVAEFVGKSKPAKTFVYRVHDSPDTEKMENFADFIRRFGYKLKTNGTKSDVSKSINGLLDEVQGKREENLIETVAIRAMAKAVYSTTNIGHYGLAFDFYTHFTSPIRRYPDMMVHRLLERYLAGGRSVSVEKWEELCRHSSEMELLASQAERASVKYKQVEFMSERLGMVFDGVISGVTEWGLYVEINENKCEGMVPIRDLDDDYYEFDEKSYCLTGRRNHKFYRLGDPIRIQVARANLERKQLDFALATDLETDENGKAPIKEQSVRNENVFDYKKKGTYSGTRSKSYSRQKNRKR
ncbi:MAG: ribonuclease R [Bacteroidales bacterium]|nr:ribonuclease R [Bacteroidales bacterium]